MKNFIKIFVVLAIVVSATWFVIAKWSFVFSKTVIGRVEAIEKFEIPVALIGGDQSAHRVSANRALFSFAIAIRQEDGQIFTASTEDRQWAAALKGICVKAMFFPYPPWEFGKGGTYFNARLDSQFDCPPALKLAE
jgi:hypothetical protein